VSPQRELRLDQLLQRPHSQLIQTSDLTRGEPVGGELGKRRSPPQRQRLLQQRRCAADTAGGQLAPGLIDQAPEPERIHTA